MYYMGTGIYINIRKIYTNLENHSEYDNLYSPILMVVV